MEHVGLQINSISVSEFGWWRKPVINFRAYTQRSSVKESILQTNVKYLPIR